MHHAHPDLLRTAADGAEAADTTPTGLHRIEDGAGARLCGTRSGRQVEIRLIAGAMVTWVTVAVPQLEALGDRAGGFVADNGTPSVVLAAFAGLGAAPGLWRDVRVRGGAEGLVAVRRARPADYPYDLWLLERLSDALMARALVPADIGNMTPPYRSLQRVTGLVAERRTGQVPTGRAPRDGAAIRRCPSVGGVDPP